MKILVVCHDFNNFGGIINHTEQLLCGLREIGHEADFVFLRTTKIGNTNGLSLSDKMYSEGFVIGDGTGYPVHQGKGWKCPYYSIINNDDVNAFIGRANTYDVIIWESIFGFKNSKTEGNTNCIRMITEIVSKQIAIIHDGNLRKLYPWIYQIRSHLTGLACVHMSAYKSAEFMGVPRALILNPQSPTNHEKWVPFSDREDHILSLQTFKAWKRVGDLVVSIPHFDSKVTLAGDGIERNYMTSKDKVKPCYIATKNVDPDFYNGKPIWDNALDTQRFFYVGYMNEKTRDAYLQRVRFLIDTSWSKTYGSHFNRVIIDAMRQGVVPIARNLGISDNESGECFLLKPNENYLMIPWNATPKEFGDKIKEFSSIAPQEYDRIVQNNIEVIKQFDRKYIAQQFMNLALGKPIVESGILLPFSDITYDNKELDSTTKTNIDKIWHGHFGFPEHNSDISITDFIKGE